MKGIAKQSPSTQMDTAKEHAKVIIQNDDVQIVSLQFDEAANSDCEDSRYGCTCISYERCCGCLLQ